MDADELGCRFVTHTATEEQRAKCQDIVNFAWQLSGFLNDRCPDSREKSLAVTHLEEMVMWATAAIVRHPQGEKDHEKQGKQLRQLCRLVLRRRQARASA